MPVFSAEVLRNTAASIFKALNVPVDDAELVAKLLVEANLTGHDSHGLIRVPIYANRIKLGAVKLGSKLSVVQETPSTAVVDGGWNLGQVVCTKAMNLCIDKAQKNVVGVVVVKHCHHIGRLNSYAEQVLEHDMIGVISVNSTSSVAPYGGKSKQLGTNPICFAIPAGKEPPMVLDMSTSVWAQGKIRVHSARGEPLPEGVLLDAEGYSTTDPDWYTKGGVLLPLGGFVGYKGYGLSLLVEVLAGALSGGGCSNSQEYRSRPVYGGNGVFMMAIKVEGTTDLPSFKTRVDHLFTSVKNSALAHGSDRIQIPGDPERSKKKKNLKEGIFIEEKTWSEIQELGKELNVKVP